MAAFYYSFVSLQIGPFGVAFKRKIQKTKPQGQFATKQKNTKMAAVLE